MDEKRRDDYLRLRIKAAGFSCNGTSIPSRTADALCAYAIYGIPPGGFLIGVLTNDLYDAVIHCSKENLENLPAIVIFIRDSLPAECYGNLRQVIAWFEKHMEELKAEAI